jgi:hypothetical protein
VNASTIAGATMSLTVICAWCRREGGASRADDPRAIVGLCAQHLTGFVDRVESLLASCATFAQSPRRTQAPEPEPARESERTVADLLRHHGGLTLCDACIASELDWPEARVTGDAEALAAREFLRDQWRCARCGTRGIVTRLRTRRPRTLEANAA